WLLIMPMRSGYGPSVSAGVEVQLDEPDTLLVEVGLVSESPDVAQAAVSATPATPPMASSACRLVSRDRTLSFFFIFHLYPGGQGNPVASLCLFDGRQVAELAGNWYILPSRLWFPPATGFPFCAVSDAGRTRSNNEDRYRADSRFGFFIVVDG